MVSFDVLTAAPAEVGPCPVLASALVKALRAELALSVVKALEPDAAVERVAAAAAGVVRARGPDAAVERVAPAAAAMVEAGGTFGVATVPFVVAAVTVPPGAF